MEQNKAYAQELTPAANWKAVVQGDAYRFTVLTDYMIRMEYQEEGKFHDRATQLVLNRQFPVPEFRVIEESDRLEIITAHLHLYYDKKPFSREGLSVQLMEGYSVNGSIWHYGDAIEDLKGTARTLDNANGAIPLEPGLMSVAGFTVLDDSANAFLREDGWVEPRTEEEIDLYFLGYGHRYLLCLQDFYRLSGATPLLPRYTLGNWWSRFYRYTEDSYMKLMNQFAERKIPFSTAVLDMDWHLTQIPERYGSGWTGYTWNRELFPEPAGFLKKLHERGMRVTLNVHPADGVRGHEDAYLEMAKELGVDYEKEDRIQFDVTDPTFMKAYFKYLHHPNEEIGVDFWWLDWQQGMGSAVKGLDTLWMLNHLHFLDSGRAGKRPLTFSRYAGIGNHRYPIGFSGDTYTTWESLQFQPYFTANATNAGYTWWSHDIGGHQKGVRDDEMVVRWIQLGVFSPIMRLHSTSNAFYGKEPWNYNMQAEQVITSFLQLRHRLIPYLYTMNMLTHAEGLPLVAPMYYYHDTGDAYSVPNQYYFGTEMIVCPITAPADKETLLAEVDAWIPEGTYIDFFTGQVYQGGRRMKLYRSQSSMPVLVKAGSIIPMAGDFLTSHIQNPNRLEVHVYAGADGQFRLYEDDCLETTEPKCAWTEFAFSYGTQMELSVKVQGDGNGVIPEDRQYEVFLHGVNAPKQVLVSGEETAQWQYCAEKKVLSVIINGAGQTAFTLQVVTETVAVVSPDKKETIYEILHKAQIAYDLKEQIFRIVEQESDPMRVIGGIYELGLKAQLLGSLVECLTGDC